MLGNHVKTGGVMLLAGVFFCCHGSWGRRLPASAADDGQAGLRAVLARAIQAAGGAPNLRKLQAFTCRAEGTFVWAGDKEREIALVASLQGLDQCRLEVEAFRSKVVIVHNRKHHGADGWLDMPNDVKPGTVLVPGAGFDQNLYALRLAQLLVPLQGKEFELSALDPIEVDARPAVGVRFTRKDYPDLKLFFDKETGLPSKSQMEVSVRVDAVLQTRLDELTFADYQETDGVKHFRKLLFERAGKKRLQVELSSPTPRPSFDDKIFDRP